MLTTTGKSEGERNYPNVNSLSAYRNGTEYLRGFARDSPLSPPRFIDSRLAGELWHPNYNCDQPVLQISSTSLIWSHGLWQRMNSSSTLVHIDTNPRGLPRLVTLGFVVIVAVDQEPREWARDHGWRTHPWLQRVGESNNTIILIRERGRCGAEPS